MKAKSSGQAHPQNERVMVFQFSETKNEVRTIMEDGNVYFVGSDVAKTLGYKKPQNAIRLHCRYALKRGIPHPQNDEKTLQVLTIPEGDVFRLIINSELDSAQKFESWVMDEVLPAIRKNGSYAMRQNRQNDFIDARDIPISTEMLYGFPVRWFYLNEKMYVINDLNRAIGASTESAQIARKLNAKRNLACKVWLFGQTNPAWCTNELGRSLLMSGSKKYTSRIQLALPLNQQGGAQ